MVSHPHFGVVGGRFSKFPSPLRSGESEFELGLGFASRWGGDWIWISILSETMPARPSVRLPTDRIPPPTPLSFSRKSRRVRRRRAACSGSPSPSSCMTKPRESSSAAAIGAGGGAVEWRRVPHSQSFPSIHTAAAAAAAVVVVFRHSDQIEMAPFCLLWPRARPRRRLTHSLPRPH